MSNKVQIQIDVDTKSGVAEVKGLGKGMVSASDQGKRAFKNINRYARQADSAFKSITKRVFSLKNMLAGGIGIYTVKRATESLLDAASDLNEVSSKFNVVYGEQTALAEKWSETLVDAYAMSRREAKQYLSSVQDLLVPMGMNSKAAGVLSNEIVKLSADLGSFNNLPTARVMDDIQSALVGNYETMKKYGIVLNATVVQEKALAMGLVKTKDELTAAHKAYAAYKLIVEGSKAAIGDMARTSDGYANQMKFLKANIENVKASLGEAGLLSTATELIQQMNEWIKTNEKFIKQQMQIYFGKIKDAIKDINLKSMVEELKNIWAVLTYDPDIIEWGLVGLVLVGKRGGVIAGGVAHLVTWANNLYKAFVNAQKGIVDFREIAEANFKELEALANRSNFFRGKIPERPKTPAETGSTAGSKSPNIVLDVGKAKENVNELKKITQEYWESETTRAAEHLDAMSVYMEENNKYLIELRYELMGKRIELDQTEHDAALFWIQEKQKEELEAENATSEIMKGVSRQTGAAMQQAFKTLYFDFMMGEFKSLKDYGTAVLKSLASLTADLLAQLTAGGISLLLGGKGNAATTFISKLFGSAKGNVFQYGAPTAFRHGDIVTRPTLFPMSRGAGLMGEDGVEGIFPLTRTRSGDLGVKAVGGGVSITNIFHGDIRDESDIDEISYRVGRSVEDAIRGSL